MANIDEAEALRMWTKWYYSNTSLSFRQYWEITAEQYLRIVSMLDKYGKHL